MNASTLTSWALLIWKGLQISGHDPRALFKELGLDPKLLSDGNARYDAKKMACLWRRAVELSGNPCIGVDIGQLWGATTFNALGFAWLASSSLGDALRRFVKYTQVINDGTVSELIMRGGDYELSINAVDVSFSPEHASLDAGAVAFVKMCRLLRGDAFKPDEVLFFHQPSVSNVPLEAYLRCGVRYKTNSISHANTLLKIRINRYDVEAELPTGNSALVQASELLTLDYLNTLKMSSVSNRVMAKLVELLPGAKVSEKDLANKLNMSPRSLQRRLLEEGTSYKALLSQMRQDMAKLHLKNSHLSLSDVAYLLGFSEQASFSRAFRRWYDMAPTDYRKMIISDPA